MVVFNDRRGMQKKKKSEITSSSSLMLNGESRTMEPCVIVNKSTSGICIV